MNNTKPPAPRQIAAPTIHFYNAPVLLKADLTAAVWQVYIALGDMAAPGDDHAAGLIADIAAAAGISPRHCHRAIDQLAKAGLITVDKSRRYYRAYHFTFARPTAKAAPDHAPSDDKPTDNGGKTNTPRRQSEPPSESTQPLSTNTNTTNNKLDDNNQLALIQRNNAEALKTLGISAQTKKHLAQLGIILDICQKFPTAPAIIRRHTPAEVLISLDPTGRIAAQLGRWAEAAAADPSIISGLSPALIWCKIVENQAPPGDPAAPTPHTAKNSEKTNNHSQGNKLANRRRNARKQRLNNDASRSDNHAAAAALTAEAAADSATESALISPPSDTLTPPAMETAPQTAAAAVWAAALAELRYQLTKAQFNALTAVTAEAVTAEALTLNTAEAHPAAAVIIGRAKSIIAAALGNAAGRPLAVNLGGN